MKLGYRADLRRESNREMSLTRGKIDSHVVACCDITLSVHAGMNERRRALPILVRGVHEKDARCSLRMSRCIQQACCHVQHRIAFRQIREWKQIGGIEQR